MCAYCKKGKEEHKSLETLGSALAGVGPARPGVDSRHTSTLWGQRQRAALWPGTGSLGLISSPEGFRSWSAVPLYREEGEG